MAIILLKISLGNKTLNCKLTPIAGNQLKNELWLEFCWALFKFWMAYYKALINCKSWMTAHLKTTLLKMFTFSAMWTYTSTHFTPGYLSVTSVHQLWRQLSVRSYSKWLYLITTDCNTRKIRLASNFIQMK